MPQSCRSVNILRRLPALICFNFGSASTVAPLRRFGGLDLGIRIEDVSPRCVLSESLPIIARVAESSLPADAIHRNQNWQWKADDATTGSVSFDRLSSDTGLSNTDLDLDPTTASGEETVRCPRPDFLYRLQPAQASPRPSSSPPSPQCLGLFALEGTLGSAERTTYGVGGGCGNGSTSTLGWKRGCWVPGCGLLRSLPTHFQIGRCASYCQSEERAI